MGLIKKEENELLNTIFWWVLKILHERSMPEERRAAVIDILFRKERSTLKRAVEEWQYSLRKGKLTIDPSHILNHIK